MKEKQQGVKGPVDYLVVKFPGNKFSGKIAPELANLEKKGIIRVLDLVFVMKDAKGKLSINEAKNMKGEVAAAFATVTKNIVEWFSEGDVDAIVSSLPNNSSAGLLLFENVWATSFKEALLDADAEMVDMGRIPPANVAEVEKLIMAKGGA